MTVFACVYVAPRFLYQEFGVNNISYIEATLDFFNVKNKIVAIAFTAFCCD
jgi:hypothetical protein